MNAKQKRTYTRMLKVSLIKVATLFEELAEGKKSKETLSKEDLLDMAKSLREIVG